MGIVALMLTNLTWLTKTICIILLIIASIYSILQDVLLCLDWSWQKVEVNHQGQLRLTTRNHRTFDVQLEASSVNHRWLTVLRFSRLAMPIGFRSVAVFSPCQVVDTQQYRKLRVWLKWGKPLQSHQALDALD
jgi:hypothetical protein